MADNSYDESKQVRHARVNVQIKQLEQLKDRSLLNVVTALKGKLDDFPSLKGLFVDIPSLPEALQKFQAEHPGFSLPPLAQQELRRAKGLEQTIETLEEELKEDKDVKNEDEKKHNKHQQHELHASHYLDHDFRYQEMLAGNQLIVELRQKYPQLNHISSISQDPEDGSVRLNRDLITEFEKLEGVPIDMFAIEEAVREEYRGQLKKENPGLLRYYDEQEEQRKYKSPDADPAIERMKRQVEKKTREEAQRQRDYHAEKARTTYAYSARRVDEDAIRQRLMQEGWRQFVRDHRRKAALYAKQSEAIRRALEEEELLARRGEAWQVPEGAYPLSPAAPSSTQATNIPQKGRRSMPNAAYASNRNPQEGLAGGPPTPGLGEQLKNSTVNRGYRMRGNNAARRQKAPSATSSKITGLVRKAIMNDPRVRAAIVIVLIIIVIIIFFPGNLGSPTRDGTYPISISKTGPDAVPNPVEKDLAKPDPSDITYTINVSFAGAADRIIVTDPLAENVDFIKAEGPGQPTYDADTRTVTWNIDPSNRSAPVASSSPSHTSFIQNLIVQQVFAQESGNGTIHDLGFGPSNGARIDAMIEKIRPTSPLIGYGDDIVKFAKEFNIDPLMIIITMKESQLCSDTGANVPGGSDPDNFNCGNITWDAAQDGADIERWNASPGETVDGHVFTYVQTMEDGLGLFFDYIDNSLYQGKTLAEFYDIYNPCSDPANQTRGYACGAKEAEPMLDLLKQYAGEACTGSECSVGTLPEGTRFGAIAPLTLVVRPKTPDSWVINQAYAQVVGGAAPSQPGSTRPSANASEFVRAAEDIRTAYNECGDPAGSTQARPGLLECLVKVIDELGYSDAQVVAFRTRQPTSLYPPETGCTQCLGYVGLVAALATGSTDPAKTLGQVGLASEYNVLPFGPNGFDVGNDHYVPIGTGISADIQVGDIAITGNPAVSTNLGNAGHIGIVREVIEGSTTHFKIIESNGNVDCRVDITRTSGDEIPKDDYTFYRKR